MNVKVKFRFNKLTGEVSEFLVDQDQELPREQHDQSHERIAGELGRLIERFPRVVELSGAPAPAVPEETSPTGEEATDQEGTPRPESQRRR